MSIFSSVLSARARVVASLGLLSLVGGFGCAPDGSIDQPGSSQDANASLVYPQVPFRGVNLAGAEFAVDENGDGSLPGVHGGNYIYPDSSYVSGYTSPAYFASKGMNVFRLPFRWERLQRSLFGTFDAAELQRLHTTVGHLLQLGAYVILDVHNYARYGLVRSSSGEAAVVGVDIDPSAFADFWSKLANEFRADNHVIFGLMNEPHDMPMSAWLSAANAAIAAIRHTGASQLILVAGNCWSGARGWTQACGGSSNADTMINVDDPLNNFAFEVHQYLDSDGSGRSDTCASTTVGSERLAEFTAWARAHGKRAFLGEFAGGENSTCLAALDDMLDHVDANADVYLGWTYWAGGPWWGSVRSLEPVNGQDKPTMAPLLNHLSGAVARWQLSATVSPGTVGLGQSMNITARVRNNGASNTGFIQVMRRGGGLPDLILRNCDSQPVALPGAGATTECSVTWTPSEAGTFTLSVGVFDTSWMNFPEGWADGLATLSVAVSAGWQLSASVSPAQLSTGQTAQVTANVRNGGAALNGFIQVMRRGGGLPDLVLRNCASTIAGGGALTTCGISWAPNESGTFKISVGVFDNAWNLVPGAWSDGLATIEVSTPVQRNTDLRATRRTGR